MKTENRQMTALVLVVMVGVFSVIVLARWIDAHQPTNQSKVDDESLYLAGPTVKRITLGFNGLAADWYWMRSLQYVGKKILNTPENVVIDDLGDLNLQQLAPLLEITTTLDPQFLEPYEYAALVLPSVDLQEAIRLTQKGIAANPQAWRLYHHLGYIYWQQRDYKAASTTYARGARISGAPAWMEAMSARMEAEGGSRALAREIYHRIYEQATDSKVKDMARRRLLQVDSLDQQDVLRQLLSAYQSRFGRCPASWREIEPALRKLKWSIDSSGAPLDPGGTPYHLLQDRCVVVVDPHSEVPIK